MEPWALPAMADPPQVRSLAKSKAWRPTAQATSMSWTQAAATAFAASRRTASLRPWRAMELPAFRAMADRRPARRSTSRSAWQPIPPAISISRRRSKGRLWAHGISRRLLRLRLRVRFQVTLARPADDVAGFAGALPPLHLRALAFQFLVDGEEVLDFAQVVGEHLVDGVDLVEARIVIGYGQYLVVGFALVHHGEHADGTHQHEDSGIARLVDQRQDVERIAVFGERPGDEAVVAGIVHGRIQGAVQAEHPELAIVLVLVGGVLGNLHNHADNLGAVAAGVDIVKAHAAVMVAAHGAGVERPRKTMACPTGACCSYRSSACAVITMASPSTAAIIFMVVQVFKLCGTVMPKYCVTIQKPESLTWENADPPAQRARISSVGEYPGIPLTSGAAMPAAVMMATVAEPCARRMAAAMSHTTRSGEMALVMSRLPA